MQIYPILSCSKYVMNYNQSLALKVPQVAEETLATLWKQSLSFFEKRKSWCIDFMRLIPAVKVVTLGLFLT